MDVMRTSVCLELQLPEDITRLARDIALTALMASVRLHAAVLVPLRPQQQAASEAGNGRRLDRPLPVARLELKWERPCIVILYAGT
jgi:hypothetical protein